MISFMTHSTRQNVNTLSAQFGPVDFAKRIHLILL